MKLLLIPCALLVLFTFIACKKNSSPNGSRPAITAIFPDSGHYGTVLTIIGSHFYSAALDNTVLIDTVAATVLYVSADSLVVSVPLAQTGPVKVTTDAGTASGPILNYEPDIVISGSQTDFTNGAASPVAVYWINGKVIPLPGFGGGGGYALCIAGSGNDIYVGGWESYAYTSAMIWKNGQPSYLTSQTKDARVNALAINGADVYAAGYLNNGDKDIAVLWKNGVPTFLADSSHNTHATALVLSSNNIYIAGTSTNVPIAAAPGTSQVLFWKNGVESSLTDSSSWAQVNSMAVSGNDVYIAGAIGNNAIYWKNGTAIGVPYPTSTMAFTGVTVANNQLYLVGTQYTPATGNSITQYSSMFLYNPPSPYLTPTQSPDGYLQSSAIAFDGSDMYVTGFSGYGYCKVHYYKNGVDSLVDEKNEKTENLATGLLIRH